MALELNLKSADFHELLEYDEMFACFHFDSRRFFFVFDFTFNIDTLEHFSYIYILSKAIERIILLPKK